MASFHPSLPLCLMPSETAKKVIVPDSLFDRLLQHHRAQRNPDAFGSKFRIKAFLQQKLRPAIPKTNLTCDDPPVQLQKIKSQPIPLKKKPSETFIETPLRRIAEDPVSSPGFPSLAMELVENL